MLSELEAAKARLLPMLPHWRRGEALSFPPQSHPPAVRPLGCLARTVPCRARPADYHGSGLALGGCSFLLSPLSAAGATSLSHPCPLPHPRPLPHPHPCSAAAPRQQQFRQGRDPPPTPPRLPAALSFQNLSLGRVLCECRFPPQLTRPTQCHEMSSSCHTFLGATDWCPHSFRTPTTSPCTVPVHKAACGTSDTCRDALYFLFSFP